MKNRLRFFSVLFAACLLCTCFAPALHADSAYADQGAAQLDAQQEQGIKGIEKSDIFRDTVAEKDAEKETGLLTECASVLKYVDETVFQAEKHVKRRPELETLFSYVFQNEDGSNTIYLFEENVKYIDRDGRIREKNIALTENQALNAYKTVSSDISLSAAKNPAEGITLSYGGLQITLRSAEAVSKAKVNTVSTAATEKSVAYRQLYGTGTELRYTPTLSGVKEDIILNTYTGQNQFEFILQTHGLCVYETDGLYYVAEHADSEIRFELGQIIAYDVNHTFELGTTTVTCIKERQEYRLTIEVPDTFLQDVRTAYPVVIDPTITIRSSANSSYIEDATVFQKTPDAKAGTWTYDHAGYYSDYRGAGRILVKLPGLVGHAEYQSITADQISSVRYYVKEATGSAAKNITAYVFNGNSWTEANATWNTVSPNSYGPALDTVSVPANQFVSFNITQLVKGWKNGTYNANKGFMLKNPDETTLANEKTFIATGFATAAYLPYAVMEYTPTITVTGAATSVLEGGNLQLTAVTRPSGAAVTWTSDSTNVATVSTTGRVTGVKAGKAVIRAAFTDSAGISRSASYTIYVRIADGVYYIKNNFSGMYLYAASGKMLNYTNVSQNVLDLTMPRVLCQQWKIKYLDDGYYSIRPMHKLDMGLDVTKSNVDIYYISTNDSFAGVQSYARWTISNDLGVYYLKNNDLALSLETPSNNVVNVNVQTYSRALSQTWILEPVTSIEPGVLLYNSSTGYCLSVHQTKWIAPEQTKTMSQLSFAAAAYAHDDIDQTFFWFSSNSKIASVDNSTGTVTGVSPGSVTITGSKHGKSISYTLNVTEIANGTYYLKNAETGRYMDVDAISYEPGAIIHQWSFHGGAQSRWKIQLQEDGYYTIQAVHSQLYAGVEPDYQSWDGAAIQQYAYVADAPYMRWRITKADSGAYILTAKSGVTNNRALSVHTNGNADGTDLMQYTYTNDSNRKDEWRVESINPISITLCGIYNSGHDHTSALEDCRSYLHSAGYNNIRFISGSISGADCKSELLSTNIFTSRSHGRLVVWAGTSTASSTGIVLSDTSGGDIFYSHSCSGMSAGSACVNAGDSFSQMDLVLFIGCETAYDGNGGRNLPTVFASNGATVAVGFSESIDCNDANKWTKDFYSHLLEGYTVQESVDFASKRRSESSGLKSAVICGDSTYRIGD